VDSVTPSALSCASKASTPTQLSREVGSDIYQLIKFKRSNQNTCINQKPVVREGDRVIKGQVIADGPCTEQGSWRWDATSGGLHAWRGYNFEDEFSSASNWCARTTTPRCILRSSRSRPATPNWARGDHPRYSNVSEHALRDLDESGISALRQIATATFSWKGHAQGETQLTPEENCCAPSSAKGGDVRDASLTCPPASRHGGHVRIFSRKGQEKDERAKQMRPSTYPSSKEPRRRDPYSYDER